MFIPGCTCCGGGTTADCPCACANAIPPFYVRVDIGSPTSYTGPAASAEELKDIGLWLNRKLCGTPVGACGFLFLGTFRAGFNQIRLSVLNDNCNGWSINMDAEDVTVNGPVIYPAEWVLFGSSAVGSTYYSAGATTFGAFKVDIHSNDQTKDLNALGQMCSITGEAELPFWSASQANFTVTIRREYSEAYTVLQFGNAKFYRGPGCPVCACVSPCSKHATLNGVTYDCLPPEINVSLSLIHNEGTFPDEGISGKGAAFVGSVTAAINNLPGMTLPLVSWDGNAATYRYDYPLYTTTYLRYEVTLYCSTVCQPAQSLNSACVKAWLINKSTATPTPDPEWPVSSFTGGLGTFSKTVTDLRIYYSGNWVSGDQIATPTLTINSLCNNGATTSTYDASGAQDLVSGTSATAGLFSVGGNNIPITIYYDIAHLTVSVP